MYGIGGYGATPTGSSNSRPDRATRGSAPITSPRTNEGKVAKKFVDGIDSMSFDCHAFAYILIQQCNDSMRTRVLDIAKAIIVNLAINYEAGIQNRTTEDALHLCDTMRTYNM